MKNNETPQHFTDSMFGPSDEEKETCIHCGEKWYVIHHKDGVCHECQKKNLPGRSQIAKTERRSILAIKLVAIIIGLILGYFFFNN